MAIELRHCDFSSHAWNEIYTWGISVFFFLSTLKMRVTPSLCEKRFSTSWHFGETKTKPQRHQSLISPRFSTLCGCGTKPARQRVIFHLTAIFSDGSPLSPHQPQGICFICVRFAWHAECLAGDETSEWDQFFHIMSRACLSVWWLITPIPVKVSAQGPTDPLTH